jgi:mitochondrial fission protein ELM1
MGIAPQFVRVLSDGRPGHENQSIGLAEAIGRRTGARVEIVRFAKGDRLWRRYPKAIAGDRGVDLLIGAGHKTHLTLRLAAKCLGAKSVVVMKPTWPLWFFDLCLAPWHDLRAGLRGNRRIIPTIGALNRVPEIIPPKQARGIVMIGGPSRHYGWDVEKLLPAIQAVVASRPELQWSIGDSRRTPADFLSRLEKAGCRAEIVPHAGTKPEWLPSQLLAAEEAWVTEDSISMIFEAVTAGARTGLLPSPVIQTDGRVRQSVVQLVNEGYATPFDAWESKGRSLPPARRLHETSRAADAVLARLFNGPT